MFLKDTFIGSAGTLLENHISDSGAAWSRHPSYAGAPAQLTGDGAVIAAGADDTVYLSAAVPASADQTAAWTYIQELDDNGDNCGVVLRADPTQNTFYWFIRQAATLEVWAIFKRVNGVVTQLAAASSALIASGSYDVSCSAVGSTLTLAINGATLLTATDTSITAAGRVGVSFYDAAGGMRVSDLSVSTPTDVTLVGVSDADLFLSPFNWSGDGATFAETACPGAYLKCAFSGRSIAMSVDLSKLTAGNVAPDDYPLLGWSIDGGPLQTHQLDSGNSVISLATGLASEDHTLWAMLIAIGGGSDKWNTPTNVLRITALQLDAGGATRPADGLIAIRSKRGLFFGDSISEGRQNSDGGGIVASAFASYVHLLGEAMDIEIGAVCYEGQGLTSAHPAAGNVPPLPASWNMHDAINSRLVGGILRPAPDFIFIAEGTNDASASASAVTAVLAELLDSIRAAAPAAEMLVLVPPSRIQSAALAAGMSAGAALVDLGNEGAIGLAGGGVPTLYSDVDGTHPNVAGQARLATLYGQEIAAALGGMPASVSSGYISSSGCRSLSQGTFEAA